MAVKNEKSFRPFTVCLVLILAANVIALLWGATLMRPSADDYCFGKAVAEHGVISGAVHWWNTWTSSLAPILFTNILVGAPLAYFPVPFISACSFIATALLAGLTVYACCPSKPGGAANKMAFILVAALCWWLFFWVKEAMGLKPYPLAYGIAHWQNLNAGYIVTLSVLFILGVSAWRRAKAKRFSSYALAAVISILAGLSGSIFAAATFGFAVFMLICLYVYRKFSKSGGKGGDFLL
ncbi:hypothetical protein LJC36_05595, partial [Desulfovibrio sp. OttesenSCG-928-C14]|nr:hypothetical protein [Desulfovibrio sp. OttesenSCG-928-C14]